MTLLELKTTNQKIYIYCAGMSGLAVYRLLTSVGVKVSAFIDNDEKKKDYVVIDSVCSYIPENIDNKTDCIVFVAISKVAYEEVCYTARQQGFTNIYNINDIIDEIISSNSEIYFEYIDFLWHSNVPELFYNNLKSIIRKDDVVKSDKRIAVYTGIFGGYDVIRDPEVVSSNCDYYYISDVKQEDVQVFKWLDAKKIIPTDIETSIQRNRYVKMLPHLIFPQYDYSVYIDGNISIKGDIARFVCQNKTGISVFRHPDRDCIYYEAMTVASFKRVIASDIIKQMKRYLEEGMPIHYGMPEMTIIGREHNSKICIQLMEDWWEEFLKGAQRDQLSFMYVMWKNSYKISDISLLGDDYRNSSVVSYSKHNFVSNNIKNMNM